MRPLIIKLFVFIIPLIMAYLYIEHRLYNVPNSYNTKRKNLEQQLNKIQVLQLGSSQAFFGVNPVFFSHYGFNLANVSQTLFYDTRLASKYIDKMPSLKLMILLVGYGSFRGELRNSDEAWREYYYNFYWDILDPKLSRLAPERYSQIFMYNINQIQNFAVHNFNVNLAPDLEYNGFQKNDSSGKFTRISDSLGSKRVRIMNADMKQESIGENLGDMTWLLQQATAHHVNVVFITTPVFATFYKFADPAILHENDSLIGKLCNEFHVKYYNYFTDKRFGVDDFADNDHLNFAGAEKFSKIMDSEIIQPVFAHK